MSEIITVSVTDIVEVLNVAVTDSVEVVNVTVTEVEQGPQGPQGPQGDPGITVAHDPPADPQINDLWVQIP